jgi:dienelactone hydrolase
MSDRREFLHQAAALTAGLSFASALAMAEQKPPADRRVESDPNQLRARLLECLGGPWPEACPLEPRLLKTEEKEGYRLEWVSYRAEPDDRIPAIVLVPDGVSPQSPAAGIAIWHQHNGQWHKGKSEPAGLMADPHHHTGMALAKQGYVVLCPDALCFEERQDPEGKLKGGDFERYEFLRYVVAGKCMAWKNILDMRRATDYLASRPEVKPDRLGCYGHSMGSTHTWLVGPWEPRLKALVGNCCLPTYGAIHRTKILHCFPNFIPGWLPHGDTPAIAGLIAPRALHLNFGELDGGSPIQEVRAGIEVISRAYAAAGCPERFTWFIEPDTGHVLSEAMWQKTLAIFRQYL